jgi:hypothetical protein
MSLGGPSRSAARVNRYSTSRVPLSPFLVLDKLFACSVFGSWMGAQLFSIQPLRLQIGFYLGSQTRQPCVKVVHLSGQLSDRSSMFLSQSHFLISLGRDTFLAAALHSGIILRVVWSATSLEASLVKILHPARSTSLPSGSPGVLPARGNVDRCQLFPYQRTVCKGLEFRKQTSTLSAQ